MPEMPAASGLSVSQYSKNFWEYEFDCRDGTSVPKELTPALETFVRRNLQPLRDALGVPIYILSAYRHEEYNKRIGGVSNSWHIYDKHGPNGEFAVDISVPGVAPVQVKFLIECLIRLGVMENGGIGLYKDFVHYDNGPRRRW